MRACWLEVGLGSEWRACRLDYSMASPPMGTKGLAARSSWIVGSSVQIHPFISLFIHLLPQLWYWLGAVLSTGHQLSSGTGQGMRLGLVIESLGAQVGGQLVCDVCGGGGW